MTVRDLRLLLFNIDKQDDEVTEELLQYLLPDFDIKLKCERLCDGTV